MSASSPPPAVPVPPGHQRDGPASSHTPSAFHPVSHSSSAGGVGGSSDWKRQPQPPRPRADSGASKGSSLSSDEDDANGRQAQPNGGSLPDAKGKKKPLPGGHEADEDEGESSAVEKRDEDDEDRFAWPNAGVSDERRQLLGAEEDSSERLSSEEEEDDDEQGGGGVWSITREQLNYYTTQFFSMQPNPHGVLPGSLAKEFFEKSRLPIAELRQIWQLSDVTKDGCLSLEEFLTAMHLVVLRRNDLALPEELPFPLQPERLRQRLRLPHNPDRHRKAHYEGASEDMAEEGEQHLLRESSGAEETKNILSGPSSAQATAGAGVAAASAAAAAAAAASPGPKPVNFDFDGRADALRRNYPNIVQPVALRASPESPVIPTSDDEESLKPAQVRQGRREVLYEQLHNEEGRGGKGKGKGREAASSAGRRKPRFQQSSSSPPQQQQDMLDGGAEDEDASILTLSADDSNVSLDERGPLSLPPGTEAPPPPSSLALAPRAALPAPASAAVAKQHMRSSSLDLNSTKGVVVRTHAHPPPPELPPRQTSVASASSSARRPEARTYEMNIHQFKEKNSVIARTINELHQEVSDALEERIALEYQLEQLKSFGE